MRITRYPLFTIKEKFKNTEIKSYELMLRAGIIRKHSSGIYIWLPTGLKILNKVKNIIKHYMRKINSVEISMPIMQKSTLWEKSGRLNLYGEQLFKIYDRKKKKMILSPTNEECITKLIKDNPIILKNLPILFFQITNKFRDEIRPCYGTIRSKEFIMKDAYSFHKNKKSLQKTYKKVNAIYIKIFKKMNLKFKIVKANSGIIGDGLSHEFQAINKTKNINNFEKTIQKIEIGHIFQLEKKYSKIMNIYTKKFKKKGKKYIYMGCYGIGITRIIPAIIEQNNDNKGIIWPSSIAPFFISIIPINMHKNKKIKKISKKIYNKLKINKIDALFYDKKERVGVIFSEMELIGIPHSIIISERNIKEKKIEYQNRKTKQKQTFKIKKIIKFILYLYKRKI